MNRHTIKPLTGWTLIAVAAFVMFATLRGKSGEGPVLPGLVPVFGIVFIGLFLVLQIGLCLFFQTKAGLGLVAAGLAMGLTAGMICESIWRKPTLSVSNPRMAEVLKQHEIDSPFADYDWTRHKLITGVCFSSVALGLGLATGKT